MILSLLLALQLGQVGVKILDDGVSQGQFARMNFTGAGVTCAPAAAGSTQVNCAVPGGGGASPLTTKGDLYTRSTVDARLPVGADGQCVRALASTSTGLEWGTCGTGAAPDSAQYVTAEAHLGLSAERVMTNGTNTTVDIATVGQLKVNLSGIVPQSLGGTGAGALTCTAGQTLTSNGTAQSCAAQPFSGLGTCASNQWVYRTNENASPLCSQPGFSSLSGMAATAQIGTGSATASTFLRGDLTWAASGNFVESSIALTEGGFYSAVVTGQTWVTSTSKIVCQPFGTTADGLTPEAVAIGELSVSTSDRVVGTGFTINVYSPNGLTGTVRFHCSGA